MLLQDSGFFEGEKCSSERVRAIRGDVSTLAHTVLQPTGRSPERAMLFLHGILGSRSNWRSFARAFVAARPDWAAVLVDLRHHGDSLEVEGPNDLDACVDDLLRLSAELDVAVRGVLGHSFGGKVGLALLARRAIPLDEVIAIDVDPAAARVGGRGDVEHVLETLRRIPPRFASRDEFTLALAHAGLGETLRAWLSMNLVRSDDGVRFGPDLDAIDALLASHRATDLLDVCLHPPEETRLRLLIAERSDAVSRETLARLEQAAGEGVLELEIVQGAGHWVQVDAPEAVRRFLIRDQRA
jgi:esterase